MLILYMLNDSRSHRSGKSHRPAACLSAEDRLYPLALLVVSPFVDEESHACLGSRRDPLLIGAAQQPLHETEAVEQPRGRQGVDDRDIALVVRRRRSR